MGAGKKPDGAKWGFIFHFTVYAYSSRQYKKRPFRSALFLFPIEDDFAGSPATHSVEAFLEVVHFEVMGDNWR